MAASKAETDENAISISWGRIAFGVLSGLGSLASIYSVWKLETTPEPSKYLFLSTILTFAVPVIVFGFMLSAGWLLPRKLATIALWFSGSGRWRNDDARINAITDCLQRLEHLMPKPVCEKHKDRICQSFLSFQKFVRNNGKMAWLLPPASDDMLLAHAEQFTESQFKEWSHLLIGQNGLLEHSKYVFITWDLTDPQDWDPNLMQKLAPMLHDLGNRTIRKGLFVHRTLIVKLDDLKGQSTMFLTNVWNPYIKPYVDGQVLTSGSDSDHYRIKFLCDDKLNFFFAGHRAPLRGAFYDVAMFSSSVNIMNRVLATSTPACVLPAPEDVGDSTEYDAWQLSRRPPIGDGNHRGIIHLYIVGNESLGRASRQKRLELVSSARKRTRLAIDGILADPNQDIDREVKTLLEIRFRSFS